MCFEPHKILEETFIECFENCVFCIIVFFSSFIDAVLTFSAHYSHLTTRTHSCPSAACKQAHHVTITVLIAGICIISLNMK